MSPSQSPLAGSRAVAGEIGALIKPGDWRSTLARWGLSAKGVLYGALGLLAIEVANGRASTASVSREGAVALVARQPFGEWLLILFTIGLFALAAWQAILVFTGDPVEGSEAKDRAKYGVKAAIYLATAITALTMVTGRIGSGGGRRSGGSEDQAAGVIMSWPGGIWLVALLGCALFALACHQLYAHAWKKAFMRRLALGGGDLTRNVERAGRTGYAARGLVLGVIGAFFVVAAIQHDPGEAVGLSGALAVLARQAWGAFLMWFVAIGLLLYGAFCFAEARYRRAI